ncbi:hypothetical protein [Grimontia sp. SpTr1]|uniref:hypothetical protein n=1 Tax=Grimontia sp. SpTr1 TaxID=2995319 RepID=UPI00248B508E|nr:hypothetical protein [Grimontia sp. SpTr1]
MKNKEVFDEPLQPSGETGVHNKFDWVKESESKLISAQLLRDVARLKYDQFVSLKEQKHSNGQRLSSNEVSEYLGARGSANKSSILLLGYAIELLLKAGIVSLLLYSPKYLLEKKVRSYGHDLNQIAQDLHIPLTKEQLILLERLSSYIVRETRYPVTAESVEDYCNQVNEITRWVTDEVQFELGINLYSQIKQLIDEIDGTTDNMKIYCRLEMEVDGFVTFRIGGPLPPVFIIKYCTSQVEQKIDNLETIKRLIEAKNQTNKSLESHLMEKSWESAVFYKTSEKKGLTKASR